MKLKVIKFLPFIFLINSFNLYSQITITEIEKSEEKIVLKPEPYDSTKNWEEKERLADYKQYIGLQIYLPPTPNRVIGKYPGSEDNFLFSIRPSIIKTNPTYKTKVLNQSGEMVDTLIPYYSRLRNSYSGDYAKIFYDSIVTFVYRPFHYYSGQDNNENIIFGVCSDSAKISNSYYTILSVLYAEKLDSVLKFMRKTLYEFEKNKIFTRDVDENIKKIGHLRTHNFRDAILYNYSDRVEYIFLLKNNSTNDSLYCFYPSAYSRKFTLVPYFVKQKNLYQNKVLIYDDEKTDWGTNKYSSIEEYDTRFVVKYEDDYGKEQSTGKKVLIEPSSKWTCTDVTLLKPSYKIYYILKNDMGEQVALENMDGFIEIGDYNKRESDKKLQYQQLLAKQKQEKLQRENNKKIEIDKRKAECISLFGHQNCELITQGKVKINMSKDMCKYAWGVPFWTSKSTTEYGTYEDWYYWLGYSLHFENGLLKRIEE